ncbi:O-antigen ligase family protein [uncultured Sphingobacterium sp.]|uniref:O-antigen ligase family protein n=1 Tax=uncultured Sphingobacterium sp. TaxID=182688 RepID=UPI00374867C1
MERYTNPSLLLKISDEVCITFLVIPLYVLSIFPNFCSDIMNDDIFNRNIFLFYFGVVGLITSSIIIFKTILKQKKYILKFSKFEIVFIIILIFNIINTTVISKNNLNFDFFLLFGQFITYFLIKTLLAGINKNRLDHLTNNIALIVSLIFCGFTAFGILQIIGILNSKNDNFIVTGQFTNPARFTMLCGLLMPFPLIWGIYNRRLRLFACLSIFLFLVLIYYSEIQTVWIASVIVLTVVFERSFTTKKQSSVPLVILGIMLISAIIGFAFFASSGKGRLLIWKISLNIFLDNPIFGIGFSNFENLYTIYQSKYFTETHLENEIFYSDVIRYPYNEYIKLLCEQGIFGFLLFLILCYSIIRSNILRLATSKNFNISYYSLLTLILGITFSLFSYPSNDPSLTTILMLSFCYLSINDSNAFKIKLSLIRTIPILILTVFFYIYITLTVKQQISAYAQWKKGNCYDLEDEQLTALYLDLSADRFFVQWYSNFLFDEGNYIKAVNTIEKNKEIMRTPNLCIILGKSYLHLRDLKKAEDALIAAVNMVPNRFIPRLHLMMFYREIGELTKCVQVAQSIISLPIKIQSDEVNFVKREAMKILKTNSLNYYTND